jgi:hypothetical protein
LDARERKPAEIISIASLGCFSSENGRDFRISRQGACEIIRSLKLSSAAATAC